MSDVSEYELLRSKNIKERQTLVSIEQYATSRKSE
jgi:hypothetical protein